MNEIILSIMPCYASEIYRGHKTIELRKSVGRHFIEGNLMYIYSSSPVKKITGYAYIKRIKKMAVDEIRRDLICLASITKEAFDKYYHGYDDGVVIWLEKIVEYRNGPSLSELREVGFSAPQSFCYLTAETKALLEVFE